MTYTLTVVNSGPSTAENVVVQDRLPPGIVVTGVSASQGSCATGTPGEPLDQLTCGLGTIQPLATVTVEVVLSVDSSVPDGTILENDALVFSDIFDNTNGNNYATNLTTVSAFADLAVTKVGEPNPVVAGELLEYTVTVTNTGPSDARGVVVVDVLPSEVTFERIRDPYATGVSCSLNPIDEHTLTCVLGNMAADEVRQFTIVVLVAPNAPAALNNQISVSSDTADPNSGDNGDTEGTGVDRSQQLFISKPDTPDPVLAGNELRYTVTFGNGGPSTATNVVVSDTLPLGVIFDRCEPLDPSDQITCSLIAGDGNTTNQVVRVDEIRIGSTTVYSDGGTIDPGDSFTFRLITQVESGYVLNGRGDTGTGEACASFFQATGYPYYAHNQGDITADILQGEQVGGQDADRADECTRVNAEADLELAGPSATGGFLYGTPGAMITYTFTVSNTGPSDAAEIQLIDLLPPESLTLDPGMITISDNRGQIKEIRLDGRITILIGNDPDNSAVNQLGRLNAGSAPVTIAIAAMVTQGAPCGATLTNEASLETRRNDAMWPPAPGAAFAPTPTEDPDLTNNAVTQDTTIACPAIAVDKTVSLDGTCPGTNNVAIGFLGQPVTYCYEVTNTGDTYLDTIMITDTITTHSGPIAFYTETVTYTVDVNLPIAPGETFTRSATVPDTAAFIDCNNRPDTVQVTGVPVDRVRTLLTGLSIVSDTDDAVVETPCKGVDWRLQLPALNTDECDTWIQVQNVGDKDTQALLVLWGDPGFCPPQAAGPLKIECTGLLRPGSAWTLTNPLLPAGAKSGIVYSMNATDVITDRDGNEFYFGDLACLQLFSLIRQDHERWLAFDRAYRERSVFYGPLGDGGQQLVLDFGAHQGEPLAVTVNRTCPDAIDPDLDSSAAYVGISTDREGIRDPRAGQYAYYAPLVWADYFGMNSIIHIQNSGDRCTSLELWFQRQGDCNRPMVWNILSLSPGEAVQFDPNEAVGPQWQGSAWLRSSQPLGVVVDTLGANHFGAYHGVPADVYVDGGSGDFSLGTQVNYAPLIYREHQGWEASIQVQNLSSIHNAKVKVTFLDNSGDVIKTVVDWICPRGSQTFFLPVIAGLPGNWIGSARIESQDWLSPGDPAVPSPRILSVVMLEKYTDPAKAARQEAVLYNALQEMGSFDWQQGLPPGSQTAFGGSDVLAVPLVSKGFLGTTTEVAIQNLNPHPGFTDFVIFIYDQNGLIDQVCEKLNEKQVEYIDLNEWGVIRPGFMGSLVISANFTDQEGGAALGAVGVERVGRVATQPDLPGDESKAFEAFPLFNRFKLEEPVQCPGQP